jgi:CBS-domain-containing membrane protein
MAERRSCGGGRCRTSGVPTPEKEAAQMEGTVAEVMKRDVVTVRPETTFREAVRLVDEHHVDGLPVVDDDRRVVGVVTRAICC